MSDKICLSRFVLVLGIILATPAPIAVIKGVLEVEEDLADFIANGPSTGIGGHVRDGYRKRCNQFANLPSWARALNRASGGGMARVCEPYWNAGGYTGPVLAPPFAGGQCAAPYLVNFTFGSSLSGPNNGSARMLGPIGGGRLVDTANGGKDFQILANGFAQGFAGCGPVTNTGRSHYRIGGMGGGATGYYGRVTSVTPCGADNCGSLPPELKPGPTPPPDPGPTPGPEPTNDPSNPTGMPLLPIPDYEDPIGGPTPIVGPDPIEPTLPSSPSGGNPDSLPGGPENVGEPIEVDPGVGGGGGGTDFGPPPAGRVWVGCLLRFNIPSEIGSIPGSAPTNTVVAAVFGNASLIVTGGLDTPERINGANMMLVRKSAAVNVNGVYVNLKPGFTYTVKPLSLEKCPDPICGAE